MGGEERTRVGTRARNAAQGWIAVFSAAAMVVATEDACAFEPIENVAQAEVCVPEVAEVEVCGRTEQITESCEDPIVTEAMHDEAARHDELKDEFQRMNACLSTDPKCDAKADRLGDSSLNEEVAAFNQGQPSMPEKIRFHLNVTDLAIVKARDDMALVVHKGFRRDPLSQHMLYRVHDDRKFNEDAEGVALVQKKMADKERAELLKQAAVLDEMKEKFEQAQDKDSAANTNQYKNIAVSRALALEAISCELDRLAQIDRRTEGRMKALVDLTAPKGTGHDAPGGQGGGQASDITGVGKDEIVPTGTTEKPPPTTLEIPVSSNAPESVTPTQSGPPSSSGASRPRSFREPAEAEGLLKGYGPDPDKIAESARSAAAALLGAPKEDDDLFLRIHRQYLQRVATGRFQGSLLD